MSSQADRGKAYKEKYGHIEFGKSPKEKYNLYSFVWALQELEPSNDELIQSYYKGLMDVPDLFPHGAAIPSSGRTVQRPYVPQDIPGSEGTDDVDLALDITCNGGTNVADFAQDITVSGGTDVADHLRDIHIGDACLDLELVKATPTPRSTNSTPPSSRQWSPAYDSMESPPPPFPPPDKGLTRLAQKLMNVDARLLDVDARLQSFIIESREQYKLIMSQNSDILRALAAL
ncbi:hypothetical protein ACOSQ2_014335 [Xanthoceras sorbifolium]